MMRFLKPLLAGAFAATLIALPVIPPAHAADDGGLKAALAQLEHSWSHIKFEIKDDDAQYEAYKALALEAEKVAQRYPGRAEPLIWQGIIASTEAGVAGSFSALGLAKDARHLFEMAGGIDIRALDGAVPTSLGSLYYLVPGFPLGFGDDDRARTYLEQGLAINPDGIDSNFFYGDFLFRQGEYAKAKQVLTHALATAPNPDRPVWDAGRRNEIKAVLAKVEQKLASSN